MTVDDFDRNQRRYIERELEKIERLREAHLATWTDEQRAFKLKRQLVQLTPRKAPVYKPTPDHLR